MVELKRGHLLFLSIILLFLVNSPFYYESQLVFADSSDQADPPKHIHLTFQGNPSSTVTVTWQTSTPTAGDLVLYDTVSRGSDPSLYSYSVLGFHHNYSGASGYIHDVELISLDPDTTYYFVCGGPGNYSGERSFKTAPRLVSDFKFIAGGDSRTHPEARAEVSQAMSRTSPSFVMHSGDMVEAGWKQSLWDTWFTDVNDNWIGDNGLTIPLIPCLGNHEENATNYYGQFALPNNEQWYYYDWGPTVRVIILNSEASSSQISMDQVNWLENVLDATPWYQWKIVMFHRNVYFSGGADNATDLMEYWVPVFDKYQVDIVFQGHTHHYHRTKPMKNHSLVSSYDEGTMYVTSGGWGAPLYGYIKQPYSAYGKRTLHFTLLSVYRNRTLHLEAKDVNGYTFDEVWLHKDVKYWNFADVVSILTNSSVSDFAFSQPLKKISFNITGISGTTGYCNVSISNQLLGGPYTVLLEGSAITPIETSNATHTFLYFTYTEGSQRVEIIGTTASKFPSTISCSVSPSSLNLGDSVTVSGSTTPAVATNATIQISTDEGATWNNLTRVTTAPDGTYSYTWTPASAGTYKIRTTWSGDSSHYGAVSPDATLIVKYPTSISCQASKTSITINDNVTISGAISPARPGVAVTISYKRDGSWRGLTTVTGSSDGSYSYTWTPTSPGPYQFKASWEGDRLSSGATSDAVSVTVVKISTTISCSVSLSEVTEDGSVTVSGSINATISGKNVTLTYKKPDGSTFNRTVTTGSDGSYSDTYEPDATGTWEVTASWMGDENHKGATSLTKSFEVAPPSFPWMILIAGIAGAAAIIAVIAILKQRKPATIRER